MVVTHHAWADLAHEHSQRQSQLHVSPNGGGLQGLHQIGKTEPEPEAWIQLQWGFLYGPHSNVAAGKVPYPFFSTPCYSPEFKPEQRLPIRQVFLDIMDKATLAVESGEAIGANSGLSLPKGVHPPPGACP